MARERPSDPDSTDASGDGTGSEHADDAGSDPAEGVDGGRIDEIEATTRDAGGTARAEGGEAIDVEIEASPDEEATVRRVRTLGTILDDAVRIPGTNVRFGLDPVLGVVPVAGDAVATVLALYPIAEAYRLDAPRGLIAKMLGLVAVDFVLGSVPVLGVLFDAFWKATEWNARALERHVQGV